MASSSSQPDERTPFQLHRQRQTEEDDIPVNRRLKTIEKQLATLINEVREIRKAQDQILVDFQSFKQVAVMPSAATPRIPTAQNTAPMFSSIYEDE